MQIGPTEYRLLHFFMTHPERVYTRTQLLDHVWGGSVYVEERTVDVHIRRLRKTLEPHQLDGMVQTVRGAGYRFSAAVEPDRRGVGASTCATLAHARRRGAGRCRDPSRTAITAARLDHASRARTAWFRTLGQLALVLAAAVVGVLIGIRGRR